MIPAEIENARPKLSLAFPTGAPMTVAADAYKCYQLLQIKQLMTCQNCQKKQYIY